MFHALGASGNDVVSFLLPLLPEAFITLFGAEAAGIANPVNPLLEPHQIAEILQAANTTILVALGPVPGTDIWKKVEQVRGKLKHLKAIVQVHGAGDPTNKVYSFSDLIKERPSDRLVLNFRLLQQYRHLADSALRKLTDRLFARSVTEMIVRSQVTAQ